MNWLDIVVIILIVGFTLAAYSAGLIREVVTLFAVVIVGIVVADALYDAWPKTCSSSSTTRTPPRRSPT